MRRKVLIGISIILLCVLIGIIAFIQINKDKKEDSRIDVGNQSDNNSNGTEVIPNENVQPVENPKSVEDGWSKFVDPEFNFEISYPNTWKFEIFDYKDKNDIILSQAGHTINVSLIPKKDLYIGGKALDKENFETMYKLDIDGKEILIEKVDGRFEAGLLGPNKNTDAMVLDKIPPEGERTDSMYVYAAFGINSGISTQSITLNFPSTGYDLNLFREELEILKTIKWSK